MTPQELRSSILQLAIQGKLVEQRAEEGTGEELYQQIQSEKQKLIKEGKIKKEKPLPEIAEDEVPFDIPENWKWVRLSNLYPVLNGDRGKNYPAKSTLSTVGIPFISALNLDGKTVVEDDQLLCLSESQYEKLNNGKLQKGDIVVCIRGSLGKHGVYPFERGAIASSLVILRNYIEDMVTNSFLMMYLDAPLFFSEIKKYDNGTAQPNLAAKSLEQFIFPLPPIAEQKRIVAKIEELLPYIDHYEQAWSKLEDFNKRFPVDMQKSILQMAIQGKLVEQRPEEGTGEELYRQIQAEKQKLIKGSKIKKEKPLPEIAEDEVPFEIPVGWKWVRLKDISTKITDGTHHSPLNFEHGEYKYVTAKNIKNSGISLTNITYVSEKVHDEIFSRCNPELGDVLLIKDGATTGVVTVNNLEEPFSLLSSVALIKMPKQLCAWYLVYVLRSDLFYKAVRAQMKGTGITRITLKQIEPMVIPLPPLAEQKRIVARLEELLPLCERLK